MAFRIAYFLMIIVYLGNWTKDQNVCPSPSLDNVDSVSTYFDLSLGILTLSMIVDLALNVKSTWIKDCFDEHYDHQYEALEKLKKAKRRNHQFSIGLTCVTSITCFVFCDPTIFGISNTEDHYFFTISTTAYFLLVALLLMSSLTYLLVTFKAHLVGELHIELKTIVTFLVYFSAVFVIRAITIVLAFLEIYPQFNTYWQNSQYDPGYVTLWSVMFIFYSAAPICYMAVVHCVNFRRQSKNN